MTHEEYNRWRKSLPKSCWLCNRFDKCKPSEHCSRNPNSERCKEHD